MRKFLIAAAVLLASAVPALASPFSDFSARVAEIRQAKHFPQMQIVEDAAALTYLQYLRDRQEGHAISNGEWRVTRWAASADCLSGLPCRHRRRAGLMPFARRKSSMGTGRRQVCLIEAQK